MASVETVLTIPVLRAGGEPPAPSPTGAGLGLALLFIAAAIAAGGKRK